MATGFETVKNVKNKGPLFFLVTLPYHNWL